jgi:RecA-family ATPase
VQDFVVADAVNLWTGESGDGKSTLALALAAAVATGQPFLGRATIQCPVVYLDRENPIAVVKDRLNRLGIRDISDRLKIWGLWWADHRPPGPDAASLIAYARLNKPLIIFDSLIAFAGCDENSSTEMRQHMQLYRELAALGATILIIHHRSEKGESDYRGSSDIRAVVDAAWLVKRDDGTGAADALGRLVLKPYKTRTGPGSPVRIEYKDGAGFVPVDAPPRPVLDIVLDLIRCRPGGT